MFKLTQPAYAYTDMLALCLDGITGNIGLFSRVPKFYKPKRKHMKLLVPLVNYLQFNLYKLKMRMIRLF